MWNDPTVFPNYKWKTPNYAPSEHNAVQACRHSTAPHKYSLSSHPEYHEEGAVAPKLQHQSAKPHGIARRMPTPLMSCVRT